MRKIVLASKSPRRKELLESLGIKFEVHPPSYEEDKNYRTAQETALTHAKHKAEEAAKHCKNAVIIGVDTLGVCKNRIIGKPKTKKEAKEILKLLNGTRHKAVTGIYIIDTKNGRIIKGVSETYVKFAKMSDREMNLYIKSGEGRDKAAGYAIQGIGSLFVEKIEGDYFNVMGLPICRLAKMLKKAGVDLAAEIVKKH